MGVSQKEPEGVIHRRLGTSTRHTPTRQLELVYESTFTHVLQRSTKTKLMMENTGKKNNKSLIVDYFEDNVEELNGETEARIY